MPKVHPVKVALAQRGESQRSLAKQLGYSPGTVGGILNGHQAPWPEFQRRCSEYLGQPEVELFEGARGTLAGAS